MNNNEIHYNYNSIHKMAVRLAEQIQQSVDRIDVLAAICRGGLIPGVIISHELKIPLRTIEWSTRDGGHKTYYGDIEEDLEDGKNIVLIDDINDSGKTFVELLEDWRYNESVPGKVITATLFQRYNTQRPSDIYIELIENDKWLCFPWEKKYG